VALRAIRPNPLAVAAAFSATNCVCALALCPDFFASSASARRVSRSRPKSPLCRASRLCVALDSLRWLGARAWASRSLNSTSFLREADRLWEAAPVSVFGWTVRACGKEKGQRSKLSGSERQTVKHTGLKIRRYKPFAERCSIVGRIIPASDMRRLGGWHNRLVSCRFSITYRDLARPHSCIFMD
jgi:hypothetical protein